MSGSTRAVAAHNHRVPLHHTDRVFILVLGDLIVLGLALAVSLQARFVGLRSALAETVGMRTLWWVILDLVWLATADVARLYDVRLASLPARSAATAALVAVLVCSLYLIIPIWSAPLTASRLTWGAFVIMSAGGMVLWRGFYGSFLTQARYYRRTVIVGAGEAASQLAATLRGGLFSGTMELVELDPGDPAETEDSTQRAKHLLELVSQHEIDDIVVAVDPAEETPQPLLDALVDCWRRGAQVYPLVDYYEQVLGYTPTQYIGHDIFALVRSDYDLSRRLWNATRRGLDVAAAVPGLLFFCALLPFVALAIWLDSRGPVFYRQQRVGLYNQVFDIIKLRTMVPQAEVQGHAVWAQAKDARATHVGRFLRKTRLDELPQFWNVLRGDMSLIGPRPERPEFVAVLTEQLPYYDMRHAVRPGLTGWAQVRYRYGSSVQDALVKLQYDLYYIKHRGPFLDILILLHTLRTVLRMEGN
jgi:exopolysaccharide biosynthesis polyprenyl glycosylphosphotransferase